MSLELLIDNGKNLLSPMVLEDVEWSTDRAGSPGKLTFKVIADGKLKISKGDNVRVKWDGKNIFYGFIFTTKPDRDNIISITAYDQLRYLKNKETYVYNNKTASQIVKMICADFNLQTGNIEDTTYKIASRVEDSITLFDIIGNALDLTLSNTKNMYVLYDNFGKINLKNIENMKLDLLIDNETAQSLEYESSIDNNSYNKIKLYYDNEKTGQRDIYIAQDSDNMNQWGVLQYYESLSEGENGKAKADALLYLYNVIGKKLSIKDVFGDCRVRAGSLIGVILNEGEIKISGYMMVESCTHKFKNNAHFMDLKLRGGGIYD